MAKRVNGETPGIGDNSDKAVAAGMAALRSYVDRIERLDEERRNTNVDIREVYAEAKAKGFNVKVMRRLISLRRQDPVKVEEEQNTLDLYTHAIGM